AASTAAWSRITRASELGLLCFCAKKPASVMTILLVLRRRCRIRPVRTMIHYIVMLYHTLNAGRRAQPRRRLLAADQRQQHRHFRAAVAPGQRPPQRLEQRLAAALGLEALDQLRPGRLAPVERLRRRGRAGEK